MQLVQGMSKCHGIKQGMTHTLPTQQNSFKTHQHAVMIFTSHGNVCDQQALQNRPPAGEKHCHIRLELPQGLLLMVFMSHGNLCDQQALWNKPPAGGKHCHIRLELP
eukprot:1159157-Pelagomonas_calceolata.AAC.4